MVTVLAIADRAGGLASSGDEVVGVPAIIEPVDSAIVHGEELLDVVPVDLLGFLGGTITTAATYDDKNRKNKPSHY